MPAEGLAWAVVGLILSGCLGGDRSPGRNPESISEGIVGVGTGTIEGTVVDSEFLPLEKAEATIWNGSAADTPVLVLFTNAEGRFVARDVAAAGYLVKASKLGYREIAPTKVDVADGVVSRLTIVLEPIASLKSNYRTLMHRTHFAYHFCVLASGNPVIPCWTSEGHLFSAEARGPYLLRIDEAASGLLESLIVESKWVPTLGACPGAVRTDAYSPDQGSLGDSPQTNAALRDPKNPYHWDNLPNVTSPTHLGIPREGTEAVAMHSEHRRELNGGRLLTTSGLWKIVTSLHPQGRLGAPFDIDCGWDQPVQLAVSTFFTSPAPHPKWSAFEDG